MGSLTPMYGLGSASRIVGATMISSPRTRIGSAGRVYQFLKKTKGQDYALTYFKNATFGPYFILNNRLVWN